MLDNVIKFPQTNLETVEVDYEDKVHQHSLDYAYRVINNFHDDFHKETGDCIYVDEDYTSMVLLFAEVISGMYMKSQGFDHPTHEIADSLHELVEKTVDDFDKKDYDNPLDTNDNKDE